MSAAVDRAHMARALALAARGLYTTSPNPRVGCVVARGADVLGEGWHERAGLPHAERLALDDARARGHDPRGATAYVTLEPCNHTGRTPPCVDALVEARVARVVAAMADPNPLASGGAARLREHRIAVETGLMADEAHELNPGFVSRMTRGRPWVRTKLAASLDGRSALDSGESRWITGPEARADGHAWRARACAILTGIGTVRDDDPELTVRAVPTTRQPRRVIVDRHAETPPAARVLAGGAAIVVTARDANASWPAGTRTLALPDAEGRVDLVAMMHELALDGVNELHVEAGARLNGALLDAGLIDEIVCYFAPSLIGEPARGLFARRAPLQALAARTPLAFTGVERFGDDLRIVARVLRAPRLMFTGIVAAVGRIESVSRGTGARGIVVACGALDASDVAVGDSIAVAGCCLTVVGIERDGREARLAFDVSAETLACTHGLAAAGEVNLEKALRLADRLGGHLMTGHVDGVGTVAAVVPAGDGNIRLAIDAPDVLAPFIAAKGSIAVDGVSLTVNGVEDRRFHANLIPHTLAATTLRRLAPGARVNLEVDLIARYVARYAAVLAPRRP